jgi:hypothetical protein
MKFPTTFTRYIGTIPAGGKQLGLDSLLVDGNGNPLKFVSGTDNYLASRMVSINGWPVNRICFAGKTNAVAAVAGTVTVYTYEDNLGCWLPLPSSAGTTSPAYTCGTNAAPSGFLYFDAMSLVDLPHVQSDLSAVQPGTGAYLCIVTAGSSPPNGTYQFVLGAEMTDVI